MTVSRSTASAFPLEATASTTISGVVLGVEGDLIIAQPNGYAAITGVSDNSGDLTWIEGPNQLYGGGYASAIYYAVITAAAAGQTITITVACTSMNYLLVDSLTSDIGANAVWGLTNSLATNFSGASSTTVEWPSLETAATGELCYWGTVWDEYPLSSGVSPVNGAAFTYSFLNGGGGLINGIAFSSAVAASTTYQPSCTASSSTTNSATGMTLSVVKGPVQNIAAGGYGGSETAINASNVSAGSRLVLTVFDLNTAGPSTTVSDTQSGTWTLAFNSGILASQVNFLVFVCNNPAVGVKHAVTYTGQTGSASVSMNLAEWSCAPLSLDISAGAEVPASGTASSISSPLVAANIGDLVISMAADTDAGATWTVAGSGWNALNITGPYSTQRGLFAYLVNSSEAVQDTYTTSVATNGALVTVALIPQASAFDTLIESYTGTAGMYWSFEDPSGSSIASDLSGNGHPLTTPSTTYGEPGLVLSDAFTSALITGASSASSSYSPAAQTAASFGTIINCPTLPGSGDTVSLLSNFNFAHAGFLIQLNGATSNVSIEIVVGNGTTAVTVTSTNYMVAGDTYLITGVWNGSTVYLYVTDLTTNTAWTVITATLSGGTLTAPSAMGANNIGALSSMYVARQFFLPVALTATEYTALVSAALTTTSFDQVVEHYLGTTGVYWPLEDTSGTTTAVDASGNGNPLTTSGFTFDTAGIVPSDSLTCAATTLSSSGANSSYAPSLSSVTLGCVVNFSSLPTSGNYAYPIYTNNSQIQISSAGIVNGQINNGTSHPNVSQSTAIVTGHSYLIVVTWDGTTITVYQCDLTTETSLTPVTTSLSGGTFTTSGGVDVAGNTQPMNLGRCFILPTALTSAEVAALATAGYGAPPPALPYWPGLTGLSLTGLGLTGAGWTDLPLTTAALAASFSAGATFVATVPFSANLAGSFVAGAAEVPTLPGGYLTLAGPGFAVQTTSSAASLTITPANAFIAGNSAILIVQEAPSSGSFPISSGTVTDTAGNTWIPDGVFYNYSAGPQAWSSFHANNIAAGFPTITFTANQTDPGGINLSVAQVAGGPIVFDTSNTVATGTGTTVTSNSLTPAGAGEIIVASVYSIDGGMGEITNGFAPAYPVDPSSSYGYFFSMFLADATGSAINTMYNQTSNYWAIGLLAYKTAATASYVSSDPIVQWFSTDTYSPSNTITVFNDNPRIGDTVTILLTFYDPSATVIESITSPMGTFVQAGDNQSDPTFGGAAWICNVTGIGNTATFNLASGSLSDTLWQATEWAGSWSAEGFTTVQAAGVETISVTVTPSAAGNIALVWGYGWSAPGAGSTTFYPAAPWVPYDNGDFDPGDAGMVYQIVPSASPVTATFNYSPNYPTDMVYCGLVLTPTPVVKVVVPATNVNLAASFTAGLPPTGITFKGIPFPLTSSYVASEALTLKLPTATATETFTAHETLTLVLPAANVSAGFSAGANFTLVLPSAALLASYSAGYSPERIGEPEPLIATFAATEALTLKLPTANLAASFSSTEVLTFSITETLTATFSAGYSPERIGEPEALVASFTAVESLSLVLPSAPLVASFTATEVVTLAITEALLASFTASESIQVATLTLPSAALVASFSATESLTLVLPSANETATFTATEVLTLAITEALIASFTAGYSPETIGEPFALLASFTATETLTLVLPAANGLYSLISTEILTLAITETLTASFTVGYSPETIGEPEALVASFSAVEQLSLVLPSAAGTYSFLATEALTFAITEALVATFSTGYSPERIGEPMPLLASFTASESLSLVLPSANGVYSFTTTEILTLAITEALTATFSVGYAPETIGEPMALLASFAAVESLSLVLPSANLTASFIASEFLTFSLVEALMATFTAGYSPETIGEPEQLTASFTATEQLSLVLPLANGTYLFSATEVLTLAITEALVANFSTGWTPETIGEPEALVASFTAAEGLALVITEALLATFSTSETISLALPTASLAASFTAALPASGVSFSGIPMALSASFSATEVLSLVLPTAGLAATFTSSETLTFSITEAVLATFSTAYAPETIGEPFALTASFSTSIALSLVLPSANLLASFTTSEQLTLAITEALTVNFTAGYSPETIGEPQALLATFSAVETLTLVLPSANLTATFLATEVLSLAITEALSVSFTASLPASGVTFSGIPFALSATFTTTESLTLVLPSVNLLATFSSTEALSLAITESLAASFTTSLPASGITFSGVPFALLAMFSATEALTLRLPSASGNFTFIASETLTLSITEALIATFSTTLPATGVTFSGVPMPLLASFSTSETLSLVLPTANLVATFLGTESLTFSITEQLVSTFTAALPFSGITISGIPLALSATFSATESLTLTLPTAALLGTFTATEQLSLVITSEALVASFSASLPVSGVSFSGIPMALVSSFTATEQLTLVLPTAHLLASFSATEALSLALTEQLTATFTTTLPASGITFSGIPMPLLATFSSAEQLTLVLPTAALLATFIATEVLTFVETEALTATFTASLPATGIIFSGIPMALQSTFTSTEVLTLVLPSANLLASFTTSEQLTLTITESLTATFSAGYSPETIGESLTLLASFVATEQLTLVLPTAAGLYSFTTTEALTLSISEALLATFTTAYSPEQIGEPEQLTASFAATAVLSLVLPSAALLATFTTAGDISFPGNEALIAVFTAGYAPEAIGLPFTAEFDFTATGQLTLVLPSANLVASFTTTEVLTFAISEALVATFTTAYSPEQIGEPFALMASFTVSETLTFVLPSSSLTATFVATESLTFAITENLTALFSAGWSPEEIGEAQALLATFASTEQLTLVLPTAALVATFMAVESPTLSFNPELIATFVAGYSPEQIGEPETLLASFQATEFLTFPITQQLVTSFTASEVLSLTLPSTSLLATFVSGYSPEQIGEPLALMASFSTSEVLSLVLPTANGLYSFTTAETLTLAIAESLVSTFSSGFAPEQIGEPEQLLASFSVAEQLTLVLPSANLTATYMAAATPTLSFAPALMALFSAGYTPERIGEPEALVASFSANETLTFPTAESLVATFSASENLTLQLPTATLLSIFTTGWSPETVGEPMALEAFFTCGITTLGFSLTENLVATFATTEALTFLLTETLVTSFSASISEGVGETLGLVAQFTALCTSEQIGEPEALVATFVTSIALSLVLPTAQLLASYVSHLTPQSTSSETFGLTATFAAALAALVKVPLASSMPITFSANEALEFLLVPSVAVTHFTASMAPAIADVVTPTLVSRFVAVLRLALILNIPGAIFADNDTSPFIESPVALYQDSSTGGPFGERNSATFGDNGVSSFEEGY